MVRWWEKDMLVSKCLAGGKDEGKELLSVLLA